MARSSSTPLNASLAADLYARLFRSRAFEEKIVQHYAEREMRCPTHLSIGQEAVAAGVSAALQVEDAAFSTHRCHSHAVAKGADTKALFAELYGKAAGCCHGKGGSMHFHDKACTMLGSSAIVGGSLPLAVGAALTFQMRKQPFVAVAYFGDGAAEQGTFHESLHFAALKKLPVLFVCENNGIATCTNITKRQVRTDVARYAKPYAMAAWQVDGTDAIAVYHAAVKARQVASTGQGPALIEATCYRWKEHVGPNTDYHLGHRSQEELERWMRKCPVQKLRKKILKENLMTKEEVQALQTQIQEEINQAQEFAKTAPFPEPEAVFSDF